MCQCKSQSCSCSPCQCSSSSKSCCQQSQCGCQSQSCGSSCGCGGGCGCKGSCKHSAKFFELADQAWMEVLKEKIKSHIQANAKNMDELAKIISEANHERWQKKIEDKECCCCFENKLKEFFHQSCQTKGNSSKGKS